jgi:DNA segregation ATPase FtsK/SpoIIIE, S-DNA-T family
VTLTGDHNHQDDSPGDAVVRYLHPHHQPDGLDGLELADVAENQPPATRPPGTELVVDTAVDGEIVDEDEAPTPTGVAMVARRARMVRATATRLRQHEPTVRTSKWLLRQLAYVFAGTGVLAKRLWDAKTNSPYARAMRAAEAAGDWDRWGDAEQRREQARERRHRRLLDLVTLPWKLTKALLSAMALLAGVLLLAGGAYALYAGDFGVVLDPLITGVTFVGWLVAALVLLFWWLVAVGFVLAVGGLWSLGRTAKLGPSWLQAAEKQPGDQMDDLPDEGTIVKALKNLNIKGFNDALKAGWVLQFLMPPTIDGKGWRCQIALPPACTVEMIVDRKPVLAHNLVRYPIEVWPTEPSPAVLDLWVAKSGALSGPIEPWTLLNNLDSARCDYFKGVPAGLTIKGDVIGARLFEANYVAGGMMGSGKSSLVITILLGAMLDPLVDIDVVVMAQNADYDPMKPRLRRLVTGAGEETVQQALAMLDELREDLMVRGAALREHDERAVTRELAEKDPRLRPRIMVIDECQNLFLSDDGAAAIKSAVKLMTTARKYAITLMFLTPEPSKDALPRQLISVTSNKACFAIGDHQGNDAVLGSGSYRAGISAVGLTPKTDEGPGDVGTCMQRGFLAKPGLMRCFYVPQADAHRVTQRALQLRSGRRQIAAAPEVRDLLTDVNEVLGGGTDPIRTADLSRLLAAKFPHHKPYQGMRVSELAARLTAESVTVPKTNNVWPVYPERVREALRARGA